MLFLYVFFIFLFLLYIGITDLLCKNTMDNYSFLVDNLILQLFYDAFKVYQGIYLYYALLLINIISPACQSFHT